MIDLHSHILPMVDDGVSSFKETSVAFESLVKLGYSGVVATPHWAVGVPVVPAETIEVAAVIAGSKGLALSVGRECRIHPNLLSHVQRMPQLRVGGGNVVMVELPWGPVPAYATDVFRSLLRAGYRPVLVHPERHQELWSEGSTLHDLVHAGVLLQVNLGSLVGQYGRRARDRAVSLLGQGMVSLVATDLHSPAEVETTIADAHRILTNLVGSDGAGVLTTHNPQALLRGEPVTGLPSVKDLLVDTPAFRMGGPLSGILGKSIQNLRAFGRGGR